MNTDVRPGMVLAGKYRLTSLIGQGGMGSVWRAEHLDLSAPVALKLIDAEVAETPNGLTRFHREAKAAAALRSPHVVQVFDHGIDAATKIPFIAMELLEGESLGQRLARTSLEWSEVADIIAQVARALARAHTAGIVHRDLKPDNVFLVHNDDHDVAKVLDFGIAKADWLAVSGASTATGTVLGTAYYMSPEQLRGTGEVDHRTDLWALGVIAHECMTRVRPFPAETLPELIFQICMNPMPVPSSLGRVPAGFDDWFAKALARNPELRFQTAKEMAEALRDVCAAGSPPTVRQAWTSEPPLSPAIQRTLLAFEALAPKIEQLPARPLSDVIPATERASVPSAPTAFLPASFRPAAVSESPPTGAPSVTPIQPSASLAFRGSGNGRWLWLGVLAAAAAASAVGFVLLKAPFAASLPSEAATEPVLGAGAPVEPLAALDSSPAAPMASTEAPSVVVAAAADSALLSESAKKLLNAVSPGASKPAPSGANAAPTQAPVAASASATAAPAPEPYDSLGLPVPESPGAVEPTPSKPPGLNLDDVLDTRR